MDKSEIEKNLDFVFRNIVSDQTLEALKSSYDTLADVSISQLGVDSLEIIKIFFNLEEMLKIQLDYEKLDLEQISTPRKIIEFIDTNS